MQCELLRAFRIGFYEAESNPLDALWFVEDEPDGLFTDLDGTPTLPIFLKCGFNWIPRIFGGCFESRQGLHIKPGCPLVPWSWIRQRQYISHLLVILRSMQPRRVSDADPLCSTASLET